MLSQSPIPVASAIVLLAAGSVVTGVLPVLKAASQTGVTSLGSVRVELAEGEQVVATPMESGERLRLIPEVGADGQTFDAKSAVFVTRERMDDGVVVKAKLYRLDGCCSKCGDVQLLTRDGGAMACPKCGVRVRVEDVDDRS